jgi:hypothetical protein
MAFHGLSSFRKLLFCAKVFARFLPKFSRFDPHGLVILLQAPRTRILIDVSFPTGRQSGRSTFFPLSGVIADDMALGCSSPCVYPPNLERFTY